MKILCFQARSFQWKSYSKTLESVPDQHADESVEDAVVAFMHIEEVDEAEDRYSRVFKHTLKHLKWLANKRQMKTIVLHSFTHLGGINATPEFASAFMKDLSERLAATGYRVCMTPFGYFSAWNLDVYGDSLAKVFKEI